MERDSLLRELERIKSFANRHYDLALINYLEVIECKLDKTTEAYYGIDQDSVDDLLDGLKEESIKDFIRYTRYM